MIYRTDSLQVVDFKGTAETMNIIILDDYFSLAE